MDWNRLGKQVNRFSISRRDLIATTITGFAATTLAASPFNSSFTKTINIKAIAFDAFPIFDPRSVFAFAKSLFPEKGEELSNVWRIKQFEYSWLRTTANQYKNFWEVTEDALVYAARKNDITLSTVNKKELMEQYLQLNTWQDVLPALETFKQNGIRLSFLSNMTRAMLTSCINHSKIENYFAIRRRHINLIRLLTSWRLIL